MSNKLKDWLDSPESQALAHAMEEQRKEEQSEADNFWEALSYEDKCNAFHAVVERIYKAEIVDNGSYRWALYDVFGFGPDMYGRGMDCGYMSLHNSIMNEEEFERSMDDIEWIHPGQQQFDFN